MLSPSTTSLADYVELRANTASPRSVGSSDSFTDFPEPNRPSLFPILDILIKILPTYYTKGRNRCLNVLIITISIAFLLSLPVFQFYEGIISRNKGPQKHLLINELFIFIMYFFPFCSSLSRLYFFTKYFDFNVWTQQSTNISCLLQQLPSLKRKIRNQLRIGAVFITILYSLFTASATWTGIVLTQRKHVHYEQIAWYSVNFLFSLLPDMLMLCVARLYFTECHLQILKFTESMNSFSSSTSVSLLLQDMLSYKMHDKYLKMYDKISIYCHRLNYFVVCWALTTSIIYWFLITICFFTDWRLFSTLMWTTQLVIPLYSEFSLFCIGACVAAVFMLWPAFKMTESFRDLKDKISQQIQVLLKNKTYLHDEQLLKTIIHNHAFGNINVEDLNNKLSVYSKQMACLEILSQLELTMNEKPCSYRLLRISLDRYSIRDFIVVILIGKVLSFMWNGID